MRDKALIQTGISTADMSAPNKQNTEIINQTRKEREQECTKTISDADNDHNDEKWKEKLSVITRK